MVVTVVSALAVVSAVSVALVMTVASAVIFASAVTFASAVSVAARTAAAAVRILVSPFMTIPFNLWIYFVINVLFEITKDSKNHQTCAPTVNLFHSKR